MALKVPDRGRIDRLTADLAAAYGPAAGSSGWAGSFGLTADPDRVEIVRAPGAVNLIGDQTDYNEGFALSAAIEMETWIAFRRRRDGRVRVASRASSETVSFWMDDLGPNPGERAGGGAEGQASWSDYVAATAWSLREAALPIRGLDGFVDTTIPAGSGLSTAAALELASAMALLGVGATTAPALAALAQRAEREYLGLNSGIVDQYTSAAGREGRALLLDSRSLDARYVALPYGIRLVVCDTGSGGEESRAAYEVRRAECARAVALLAERMPGLCSMGDLDAAALRRHRAVLPARLARRVDHVISENGRVTATTAALEAGDLDELGRIFAESHASLRDRYEISTPALDAMVDVAAAVPGVVAARMTGTGGSCTVNLVLADAVPALEAAVSRAYGRRTGLTGHVYPVAIVDGAGPVNPEAG